MKSKKEKKKGGHDVRNVNIADSVKGYILSNPTFQTAFNTEETSFDVYFFFLHSRMRQPSK